MIFFDFIDGDVITEDQDGHDCDGLDSARVEVLQALPEVLLSDFRDVTEREVTCSIRNERGEILYRASVTLKLHGPPVL